MSPKVFAARSITLLLLLVSGAIFCCGQARRNPTIGLTPPNPTYEPPSALALNTKNVSVDANGKPIATNEYACFLPPLTSVSPATVGVIDLQVPPKSQYEYQSGCDALRKKKFADAEKHLRKAIEQYEKYAAAWVLLGQVLEIQQKPQEARDACSRSSGVSSTYLPAFLCLTYISAGQKNWDDTLKFSARVLELDPSTNPVAYALNATANLNLHHLAEAEKNALKALEIDVRNSEPRIHFLLAQIYAAKNDRPNTAAQLREYLKFAKDPDDIAVVKSNLAALDGPSAKAPENKAR
ncbi:MAG TPA: tetratricopeptide repeat protein [Terriglobales bacterium]|nr:tetratricopeptide repeat protein [Terriglobales bacterium]